MTPEANGELEQLVQELLSAALALLAERAKSERVPAVLATRAWLRVDDERFVPWRRTRPRLMHLLETHLGGFRALKEYEAFTAAIASSSAAPRIGALVGTGLQAGTLDVDTAAITLVRELLDSVDTLDAARSLTVEHARAAVAAFTDDDTEIELSAHLSRLQPAHALSLEGGFEITELTDGEVALLLDMGHAEAQRTEPLSDAQVKGLRERGFEPTGDPVRVPGRYKLNSTYRVKMLVGEHVQHRNDSIHEEALERFLDVLRLISVLKSGYVWVPGVLRRTKNLLLKGSFGFVADEPNVDAQVVALNEEELERYESLWTRYQDRRCQDARWLRTAIRRFAYANARHRPADRIVDLMTAAESIYLRDKDELSYKLGVRAAFFLEREGSARLDVFRDMRAAYAARSTTVHGVELPLDELRKSSERGEALVRRSLDAAIRHLADGGALGKDGWEKAFIFAASTPVQSAGERES